MTPHKPEELDGIKQILDTGLQLHGAALAQNDQEHQHEMDLKGHDLQTQQAQAQQEQAQQAAKSAGTGGA